MSGIPGNLPPEPDRFGPLSENAVLQPLSSAEAAGAVHDNLRGLMPTIWPGAIPQTPAGLEYRPSLGRLPKTSTARAPQRVRNKFRRGPGDGDHLARAAFASRSAFFVANDVPSVGPMRRQPPPTPVSLHGSSRPKSALTRLDSLAEICDLVGFASTNAVVDYSSYPLEPSRHRRRADHGRSVSRYSTVLLRQRGLL
jgi:hypothetical protein